LKLACPFLAGEMLVMHRDAERARDLDDRLRQEKKKSKSPNSCERW
jgi:hypothetical protein